MESRRSVHIDINHFLMISKSATLQVNTETVE
jgi:hypothetical protein